MPDMTLFQGVITSLKTANDIVQGLISLKVGAEVNAKAIELQQIVMAAQANTFAAQSEQFSMLERIRELEKKIADLEAWETEKKRYQLVEAWPGALVFALKEDAKGTEPPHWICQNCYEDGRKSRLHLERLIEHRRRFYVCPHCKTKMESMSGEKVFTYA